jgi:hypothetical protein
MREIRERQFRLRHALAHGLDAGVLRTLRKRFQRQRIKFSDKTHKAQGNKSAGKVEAGKFGLRRQAERDAALEKIAD